MNQNQQVLVLSPSDVPSAVTGIQKKHKTMMALKKFSAGVGKYNSFNSKKKKIYISDREIWNNRVVRW